MRKLWYLLRTTFCSYTATALLTLFSIVAAVLGMNVVLAYAESSYQGGRGSTTYTVLTLAELDAQTKQTDMLARLGPLGATAAVYICRSADGAVLVGFDGSDKAENWWGKASGEFVNETKGEDYPHVIFLGAEEAREIPLGSLYDLDGRTFRVIGCGSVMPASFTRLISSSSPQTVFERSTGPYSEGHTGEMAYWCRVIPYEAFRESYEPELILLHFPELTHPQLLQMRERLEELFPGSTATGLKKDARELFGFALERMGSFLPLFLLLSEITVVLSLCELLKKLRAECYVWRICGMSRRRMRALLVLETGVFYLMGTAVAVPVQLLLKDALVWMNVDVLPTFWEIACGVLTLFGVSVLLSLPERIRSLRIQRSGEE